MREELSLKILYTAKKGYEILKTVTGSYKIIKELNENVQDVDKTLTVMDETITSGKQVVNKANDLFYRMNRNKNKPDKIPNEIIVKPITNNKEEIYEWMYYESASIHNLLVDSIYKINEKPCIPFRVDVSKDKLLFYVTHLSDWKKFKDSLLIETFTLKPRLEKLNEYNFDEQDMKRINDSKELVNGLNAPKSNLELVRIFNKTDKLLRAYYYREFLNEFLFKFLRTKTIEEVPPEEREKIRKRVNFEIEIEKLRKENREYLKQKRS